MRVFEKMSDFTYIRTSSRNSNLDHIAVSSNLTADTVNVIFDYQLYDHLPITCSIGVPSSVCQSSRLARDSSVRRCRRDWSKIDQTQFLESVDSILSKINVPFPLLQKVTSVA